MLYFDLEIEIIHLVCICYNIWLAAFVELELWGIFICYMSCANPASDLVKTKVRTPFFYTLPKRHKCLENPPGRPIVSSNKAPMERISAFVDPQLKPLVVELQSFIRDTKDFLVQLQSIPPLPHDTILFTMDVVGVYSNIPHEDGLDACHTFLDRRSDHQLPTGDVINLARMVLKLNAFAYRNDHFLQVHGTAMGTKMAPSYANL